MNRRSGHPPGMPCWVAVICPDDAEPATAFYAALFGWEFENIAGDGDPPFYLATLDGDRVASVAGSGNGEPGVWITAVSVADRDAAAAAVRDAGGSAPAGDTVDIASLGRFHRVHDPTGAEIHLVEVDGTVAQRVGEPGAWTTSCLHHAAPDPAAGFYEAVFGWRTDRAGATTVFRLPGPPGGEPRDPTRDVVATAQSPAPWLVGSSAGDSTAVWIPDFRVSDADLAARTAGDRGGSVLTWPSDTGTGYLTALLADPGGARFTISQEPDGD